LSVLCYELCNLITELSVCHSDHQETEATSRVDLEGAFVPPG